MSALSSTSSVATAPKTSGGGATFDSAKKSADEAAQAGLDGAVQANKARAEGSALSAAKTEATELAKGI